MATNVTPFRPNQPLEEQVALLANFLQFKFASEFGKEPKLEGEGAIEMAVRILNDFKEGGRMVEARLDSTELTQQEFLDVVAKELFPVLLPLCIQDQTSVLAPGQPGQAAIDFGKAALFAYNGANALWLTRQGIIDGAIQLMPARMKKVPVKGEA
jgi:hypothetical protein